MRVAVTISVEVDVKGWNQYYGQAETPAEIRETIRASYASVVEHEFEHVTKTIWGQQRPDGYTPYTTQPVVKVDTK